MKTYTGIAIIAAGAFTAAALNGQSLVGSVTGADTGAPIPASTVIAVQQMPSLAQKPVIYLAVTDGTGHYAIGATPGVYRLCVQGAGLYLDPCIWGGAAAATVTAAQPTSVNLRLIKGWRFIVRVHDKDGFLPQAEAVHGQGVSASAIGGSAGPILLPLIFDDGRIRDYGAVVPQNTTMTAIITASTRLNLTDATGAAPSTQGIPFQASPPASASTLLLGHVLPPPDATVVHIYAKGVH